MGKGREGKEKEEKGWISRPLIHISGSAPGSAPAIGAYVKNIGA